jgi:hypothetical protein
MPALEKSSGNMGYLCSLSPPLLPRCNRNSRRARGAKRYPTDRRCCSKRCYCCHLCYPTEIVHFGPEHTVFVTGLQPSPHRIESNSGQGKRKCQYPLGATPNSSCVVGLHSGTETQTAEMSSGIQQQQHEPKSVSFEDSNSNPTNSESPTANSDEAGVSNDYPPVASQPEQASSKLKSSGSDDRSGSDEISSQLPASPL